MINPSARTTSFEGLSGRHARRDARLLCPGRVTRAVAFLRRSDLDRSLSQGADPATCAQLAARAAQLTSRGTRSSIAEGLERLALSVDEPRSRARIYPSRQAALTNRPALFELASVLRRGGPVYAGGVARLRLLVTDGTGPAYTDRRGEALARSLQLAAVDLAG
jgi:hypothetical protein